MRAIALCALAAACGGSSPMPFNENGGSLTIPSCGYTVTTKYGAEPPKASGNTFGADPTPAYVHLGWIGDPSTTMVAQWRTNDETTTAGFVRYAEGANLTADQLTNKANGIEFGYRGTGTSIYRMHQAHMCGLSPGTTYSYQVGATKGSTQYLSPVYTFTTAPDITATPDAEVKIGVLGDSRLQPMIWGQVAAAVQAKAVDFLMYTGDAVFDGSVQTEWDDWSTAAAPVLATTPIMMINGNHEDNEINFYAQFTDPGDQENFGFDYGYAHFTIANDTPENGVTDLATTTLQAMQSDFAASANARWKLLVHHRPLWSSDQREPGDTNLQAAWGPTIDQYAIDLVLNGHAHDYEITKPLKGGAVQSSNAAGTVFIVAGGAGADLDVPVGDFYTAYLESTFCYGVLDVRTGTMTYDPFRLDGTAIATGFSKTKP